MSPAAKLEYIEIAMQGYERRITELERQIIDIYRFIRELRDRPQ